MFRILHCVTVDKADYYDSYLDDKQEALPGDHLVEFGEVKKLYKGSNSIKVLLPDDNEETSVEVDIGAYNHYFGIWEKWHYLKMLPNSNDGWIDEVPWIVDLIIMFEKLDNELQAFKMKRANNG